MSPYSPAMLILALEGVVVLAALSGMLLYLGMRKSRIDRAGATRLVGRIKKDEGSRREKLTGIFKSCYGLDEEELTTRVDEFVTREKAFYKTLIALYLDRDSSKLAKFTEDLEEVIGPCLELAARKPAEDSGTDVQELREQNGMLERELQSTRRVMETLMSEYNAAFNKEALTGETPVSGETVELEDETAKPEPTGPVGNLLKAGQKRDPDPDDEEAAPVQDAAEEEGESETDDPQPDQGTAVTDKDIDRIMEAIDEGEEQAEEKPAVNQG